jgi:cobalt-zinc-cadmium efflux system outer membrane protein
MLFPLLLGACYQQSQVYLEAPSVSAAPSPVVLAEASGPLSLEPPAIDAVPAARDEQSGVNPGYAGSLTLGEAVHRALRFSPLVQAAEIEIDAKRAEALQAGLRPNPEFGGDVQNIAQDAQESTIELAQVFELGGKRLKRLRAAELEVGVAAWELEAARLRVASDTAQAFVDVLASQDRIAILEDLQTVAEKLIKAVAERVKAGKGSPVESQRVQIEGARAKAELRAEEMLLLATKRRLANNWGARYADFGAAQGGLATTNHIPSVEQVSFYLESNPEIARWAAEMTRRRAVLALARAQAVPDLTLGAGARRVEENEETGAVVGLSIPIPLFNRNQGNIAAAQTRIFKAERESLAARTAVTGLLLEAYGRLVVAAEKLKGLEKDVLPAAEDVYGATIEGYTAGKFDLLSVLDAQRTLFSTRLEIVNARAEFQKAKVQIEALIGRGLYGL